MITKLAKNETALLKQLKAAQLSQKYKNRAKNAESKQTLHENN